MIQIKHTEPFNKKLAKSPKISESIALCRLNELDGGFGFGSAWVTITAFTFGKTAIL